MAGERGESCEVRECEGKVRGDGKGSDLGRLVETRGEARGETWQVRGKSVVR